ncbi:MAG TPA: polysaccharide deacetylase family protein [Candidatus Binatia bacterium]|nr:polysaccharide deacetylase family protein [Candidatus Binatia bacterium]
MSQSHTKPVSLSFDNGPWPGVTDRVLDLLAERSILTTFFVVGDRLRDTDRRKLAERAFEEGHWIGNHTMTHSVQLGPGGGDDVLEREIGATQNLIGPLAHESRWFRPYGAGGELNPDLLSEQAVHYLQRGGYSCVLWSSVPRDWEPSVDWVDRCMIDASRQDWPLVVLHDLPGCCIDRLPELLDRLEAGGFETRQDFPPSCVPIRAGAVTGSLKGLVRQ